MTPLQLHFPPGTSIKKVARLVHASKSAVEAAGFEWDHADMHEHEVNLLQRYLVDTLLSSGENCISIVIYMYDAWAAKHIAVAAAMLQ